MRRFVPSLLPLILLLLLVGFFLRSPSLLPELRLTWWTRGLPYGLLAIAGILAWRFNRSLFAFLCLYLILIHFGLTQVYPRGECSLHFRQLVGLATPPLFAWFYLGRDRGVLSEHGMVRLVGMGAIVMVLALLAQFGQGILPRLLPSWSLAPLVSGAVPVPRLAVVLFLAAWGVLLAPSPQRDPAYGPLLGTVLLGVLIGLCCIDGTFLAWRELPSEGHRVVAGLSAASLALGAAGAITLFAVLEISHGTAFLDPLTQIPGRRALDYRLSSLGRQYAIAMVDIDHFKKVNDKYGHDVGDQALRFVAAKLRKVPLGRAYRYGGEEFSIVFPGRTVDDVEAALNALREEIQTTPFYLRETTRPSSKLAGARRRNRRTPEEKTRVAITVSIGAADSGGEDDSSAVIVEADKALYKAKKTGRNRVVVRHHRRLDVGRVLMKL